jgi:hypothetical protein
MKKVSISMAKDPSKDCKGSVRYIVPKGTEAPATNVYVAKSFCGDGKLPLTMTLELGMEVEI